MRTKTEIEDASQCTVKMIAFAEENFLLDEAMWLSGYNTGLKYAMSGEYPDFLALLKEKDSILENIVYGHEITDEYVKRLAEIDKVLYDTVY
jgi:hypothetical protein